MHVLLIDGDPEAGRSTTALLEAYREALPAGVTWSAIAARELILDPPAYGEDLEDRSWGSDVEAVAREIDACDHLVIGFPLHRGSEPATLTTLLNRVLVPGFSLRYRAESIFREKRQRGRSADLVVTMDSPGPLARLLSGDRVGRRWKAKALGFVGIGKRVRVLRFGPDRDAILERVAARRVAEVERAARTIPQPKRDRSGRLAGRRTAS